MNSENLSAKMEPFDSFWEAPSNIEKGFKTFGAFYSYNYLKYIPENKAVQILVISCGYGYFVNLLNKQGYTNVLGIDSDQKKIEYTKAKSLNTQCERALEFLQAEGSSYDVIILEQELNHLEKEEILYFMDLCCKKMNQNGLLISHSLNGANPITGAEALAQNYDHFNTFTEYSLKQAFEFAQFVDCKVFPLSLYVFWKNPINYILILLSALYTMFFRISFMLYGKKNKIFTKKIGIVGYKR